MTSDPTLRADLMAFLSAADARGEAIRLSTPDYAPMCSGLYCDNDPVPGQRYCRDCRQAYDEKHRDYHRKTPFGDIWFHENPKQILRAYRFLRRRANQAEAA